MSLVPINPEQFAAARWSPMRGCGFARGQSLVELNASEAPAAACHLPTAFVRMGEGPWTLQALLGVAPGKNLFVAADGSWLGGHWPLRLRLAPFALAQTDSGETALCINADWWQPDADNLYPFYTDGKTLAAETAAVLQECQALLDNHARTLSGCAALDEAGLLAPWSALVRTAQGNVQLEGLFAIDEAALNAIDASTLAKLRDTGALAIAYCQLISMQHLPKLGELADAHARLDTMPTPTPGGDLNLDFLASGETLRFGNSIL